MKFRKYGKALLMTTLSAGAILGVTSCVQSYTVGFLYVTGTDTAKNGEGIISGFKIDHNTGQLRPVNGLPVSSGGSNPGRALLIQSSRFLYVLNRGADPNANGGACTAGTTSCTGANISLFTVGGNGSLSAQPQQFSSQGNNPFRIIADPSGSYVFVLDHDAPDSGVGTTNSCTLALGTSTTSCGDITVFKVDPTTGRLSLLLNAQVTSASGQPLPYFPVPADPIDFQLNGTNMLTLAGNPTTGDEIFPYTYASASGQLTVSQNGAQALNLFQATALQTGNSAVYVLDNEPLTISTCANTCVFSTGTYPAQVIPYTVGTGGSLQAATGGPVPIGSSQSNPQFLISVSSKWTYVADSGDNTSQSNPQSGITGYQIDTTTKQLRPMPNSPFGSQVGIGAGPQCLIEDPSNQFIYTANFNDSTVTGVSIDQNVGVLNPLPGKANQAYGLPGPAAYCLVNSRTS